jgi:transcription factor S
MEFCPKCGGVLIEKRKNFGCSRCTYTAKGKIKIEASEKMIEKERIGVIKEKDIDVFPVTAAKCSKCGNNEAYFWTTQTRGADETETRFFRCKKCSHTWREYR